MRFENIVQHSSGGRAVNVAFYCGFKVANSDQQRARKKERVTQQSRLWLPSPVNPQQPELPLKELGLPTRPALLGRFLPAWRSAFYQRVRRLQLSLTLKLPLGAAEHTGSPHSSEQDDSKGGSCPWWHRTTMEPNPCGARPGAAGKASHLPHGCCQNPIPVHFTVSVPLIPAVCWADLENIPNNIKVADKVIEHNSCAFC